MAELREIVVADPYAVLGVAEDADDEAVKRRYLALVRAAPPDREPERFQTFRAAYEAIRDARARARLGLLHSTDGALRRLKRACLQPAAATGGRAAEATVTALLADGLQQVAWE